MQSALFLRFVLALQLSIGVAHNRGRTRQLLLSDASASAKTNHKDQPALEPALGELKRSYPWYHTSEELRSEVRRLAAGCGGAVTSRTVSRSGVDIEIARVRAPGSSPINRVFLLFGEHARELISPETGVYFLRALCGEAPGASDSLHSSAAALLQDSEFEMVVNGNPGSRSKVETGNFCLRANPSGVDLNRNWDEHFDKTQDSNGGSAPFSEPETKIFKQLVTDFKPTTFLTVHSGTRGLYMPWAYTTDAGIGSRNQASMLEILRNVDEKHCQCPYGAAGKEVGYSCPGTCLDWVYDHMDTPFTFAFEIYAHPDLDEDYKGRWQSKVQAGVLLQLQNGSNLASPAIKDIFEHHPSDFVQVMDHSALLSEHQDARECFGQFNPWTEEHYNEVLQNWAGAYVEMTQQVVANLKRDPSLLQSRGQITNER